VTLCVEGARLRRRCAGMQTRAHTTVIEGDNGLGIEQVPDGVTREGRGGNGVEGFGGLR